MNTTGMNPIVHTTDAPQATTGPAVKREKIAEPRFHYYMSNGTKSALFILVGWCILYLVPTTLMAPMVPTSLLRGTSKSSHGFHLFPSHMMMPIEERSSQNLDPDSVNRDSPNKTVEQKGVPLQEEYSTFQVHVIGRTKSETHVAKALEKEIRHSHTHRERYSQGEGALWKHHHDSKKSYHMLQDHTQHSKLKRVLERAIVREQRHKVSSR